MDLPAAPALTKNCHIQLFHHNTSQKKNSLINIHQAPAYFNESKPLHDDYYIVKRIPGYEILKLFIKNLHF